MARRVGRLVNVNDVREQLAEKTTELLPYWTVDTRVWAPLNATRHARIGHATDIGPDTYRRRRATLTVTLWVNEEEEAASVADLYEAISFAPGTYLDKLPAELVGQIAVGPVGPREEGPTGFIAVDLTMVARWQ